MTKDDGILPGTYDILNTQVIGLTEVDLVQDVYNSVLRLIVMEKRLEEGGEDQNLFT